MYTAWAAPDRSRRVRVPAQHSSAVAGSGGSCRFPDRSRLRSAGRPPSAGGRSGSGHAARRLRLRSIEVSAHSVASAAGGTLSSALRAASSDVAADPAAAGADSERVAASARWRQQPRRGADSGAGGATLRHSAAARAEPAGHQGGWGIRHVQGDCSGAVGSWVDACCGHRCAVGSMVERCQPGEQSRGPEGRGTQSSGTVVTVVTVITEYRGAEGRGVCVRAAPPRQARPRHFLCDATGRTRVAVATSAPRPCRLLDSMPRCAGNTRVGCSLRG